MMPLDEVRRIVMTTKRKRSPIEATLELTNAYAGFLLAYGYARAGRVAAARELATAARGAFAKQLGDPVHAYLTAAFDARIEATIAHAEPPSSYDQLAALDDVARYKVDRVRESSRILNPLELPIAIQTYSEEGPAPELAPLKTTDRSARATAAGELLDAIATLPRERRARVRLGVFGALADVDPDKALLRRAALAVAELPEPSRYVWHTRLLLLAERAADADLLSEVFDQLARSTVFDEDAIVTATAVAKRAGWDSRLAELLAAAQQTLAAGFSTTRIALAGGFAALGRLEDVETAFLDAQRELAAAGKITPILAITRALAVAYAYVPRDTAVPRVLDLATRFSTVTDAFGTNSHFCLSVLHFVESLVVGVVPHQLSSETP